MGYPVYDCDSEAKRIMDNNSRIHLLLCENIHPDAVTDGKIDRKLISEIVFSNPVLLEKLNHIVHASVFEHLEKWKISHPGTAFVESAILRSSGLINLVDSEWHVTAPLEVRIERVGKRSSLTREQIIARIRSQADQESANSVPFYIIDNSPLKSILPQIHNLLEKL